MCGVVWCGPRQTKNLTSLLSVTHSTHIHMMMGRCPLISETSSSFYFGSRDIFLHFVSNRHVWWLHGKYEQLTAKIFWGNLCEFWGCHSLKRTIPTNRYI